MGCGVGSALHAYHLGRMEMHSKRVTGRRAPLANMMLEAFSSSGVVLGTFWCQILSVRGAERWGAVDFVPQPWASLLAVVPFLVASKSCAAGLL